MQFDNRVAQRVHAGFSFLVVLFGLAGLAQSPPQVSGFGVAVIGGFYFFRARRSSAVVLDKVGVSLRSIVRTRRLLWSELSGVQVVRGRTGLLGPDSEHLRFRLRTGDEVGFRELNAPIPGRGRPTDGRAPCSRRDQ